MITAYRQSFVRFTSPIIYATFELWHSPLSQFVRLSTAHQMRHSIGGMRTAVGVADLRLGNKD